MIILIFFYVKVFETEYIKLCSESESEVDIAYDGAVRTCDIK